MPLWQAISHVNRHVHPSCMGSVRVEQTPAVVCQRAGVGCFAAENCGQGMHSSARGRACAAVSHWPFWGFRFVFFSLLESLEYCWWTGIPTCQFLSPLLQVNSKVEGKDAGPGVYNSPATASNEQLHAQAPPPLTFSQSPQDSEWMVGWGTFETKTLV